MTNHQSLGKTPGFFHAMLKALQFENASNDAFKKLTDGEWHEMLEFGDLAHLTLYLADVLREVAPDWVIARLGSNLADNKVRSLSIKNEYIEIARTLKKAEVTYLLIKGFTLYPEFVDNEYLRFQSDIDFYCSKDAMDRACEAFTQLGYEPDQTLRKAPADHLPVMARKTGWKWRGNMYDPEMPPSIDLHFCLWNPDTTKLEVQGVEGFWDRRVMRSVDGFDYPALHPVDNLGYCALHVLRDLQRGDWVIHHVYEIAWFLHHHAEDDGFWKQWMGMHDRSLRSLETIAFWLARDWFRCNVSPLLAKEISQLSPFPERWLQSFSASPLTGMFHPNKDGTWLHASLLSSWQSKIEVLKSSLVPTRVPIVGAPGQNTTKTRRRRRFWPSQLYVRYVLHILFRIGFHARLFLPSVFRGIRLWALWRKRKNTASSGDVSDYSLQF